MRIPEAPLLVFDGHNDALLNLHLPGRGKGRSFFERSNAGHVDLSRAIEGGFGGGFFACYVPAPKYSGWTEESALAVNKSVYAVAGAPPLDPAYARDFAAELAKGLFRLEVESEGRLKVARTVGELSGCLRDGVLAAILHFEGAENLGPDPGTLEDLYGVGLRSLGLVWSRPNAYGHGVPFRFRASPDTGPGLTGAGRDLVRECNRLGVLVDLSHLNERGFWDVAALSDVPLVATHSNAHALCPSTRNLTDRQLRHTGLGRHGRRELRGRLPARGWTRAGGHVPRDRCAPRGLSGRAPRRGARGFRLGLRRGEGSARDRGRLGPEEAAGRLARPRLRRRIPSESWRTRTGCGSCG